MKRTVAAGLLGLTLLTALAAPAVRAEDAVNERLDALENRVRRLENYVARTESSNSRLAVIRWSAAFKRNELSNAYVVTYVLANRYDKPLKLINGTLDFLSPEGTKVYSIPVNSEAHIEAGGEASFGGTYFINPAEPEQLRLRDLPPAEVIPRLHLTRIVFRDNTLLRLE